MWLAYNTIDMSENRNKKNTNVLSVCDDITTKQDYFIYARYTRKKNLEQEFDSLLPHNNAYYVNFTIIYIFIRDLHRNSIQSLKAIVAYCTRIDC